MKSCQPDFIVLGENQHESNAVRHTAAESSRKTICLPGFPFCSLSYAGETTAVMVPALFILPCNQTLRRLLQCLRTWLHDLVGQQEGKEHDRSQDLRNACIGGWGCFSCCLWTLGTCEPCETCEKPLNPVKNPMELVCWNMSPWGERTSVLGPLRQDCWQQVAWLTQFLSPDWCATNSR